MRLSEFFERYRRVAVAFSGGTDSTYLLHAAKSANCDVRAYFVKTQFQPRFELQDAVLLADQIGVSLTVESMDILCNMTIASNPANRCYYCKTNLFTRLLEVSSADGCEVLCDGTNADDDEQDRPGVLALRELGILSPLRECGLTKADVRRLSKEAGLFTHRKPSYSCLATRIPTGTPITQDLLDKIECSEDALFRMGLSDFRVRIIPPCIARLQIQESQFDELASRRDEVLKAIGHEFDAVVLDFVTR